MNITSRIVAKHPAEQGLVIDAPLKEGSGTQIHDLSEYGELGTTVNSPVWNGGPWGSALQLIRAQTQHAEFPASPQTKTTTDQTLWVWVNHTQLIDGVIILSKRLSYYLEASANQVNRYRIYVGAGLKTCLLVDPFFVDIWYSWAGTFDNAEMAVYRDNVELNTTAQAGPIDIQNNIFTIGCQWTGIFYANHVDDQVSGARLYDRKLTADERMILQHHAVQPLRCGG